MRKIILDLDEQQTKKELWDYIAEKMEFKDYFGRNLDALYDGLTSICAPTAVGIYLPVSEEDELDIDLLELCDNVVDIFHEAEGDNENLAVFVDDISYYMDYDGDDYDEYVDGDLTGEKLDEFINGISAEIKKRTTKLGRSADGGDFGESADSGDFEDSADDGYSNNNDGDFADNDGTDADDSLDDLPEKGTPLTIDITTHFRK